MTEAAYLRTEARTDAPFRFTRERAGEDDAAFLPGAGAKMRFANRDVDTLTMPGLPVGFLAAGDKVRVEYRDVTVFVGEVDRISRRRGGGADAEEEVVCCGPWSKMERLVYRQYWATADSPLLSSRLILNQYADGTEQRLDEALYEIADDAAAACGYTVERADVAVSAQKLPFDECRDITVADAIRRELRFFPKAVCRFDYSGAAPALKIVRRASSADAAYVAAIPKTDRQYKYNAHPINGVDLEIETTEEKDGVQYRAQYHQTEGNVSAVNPDCLYATLQIPGSSASTVRQSFKSVTENLPTSLNDVDWWKAKHPRLANVAASAITINSARRSGESDAEDYPRISAASPGEIREANLRCRVEKFEAEITIDKGTDREEDILLTMNFLTTNAEGTADEPHVYQWNVESTASSGETAPSGLAAAILADRSGVLRAERMSVRLSDALPTLGDCCDGLFLQSFEVDCAQLTALLDFGAPEYLSPEDMAALLSGFRNKRTSNCATSRVSGKIQDDGSDEVGMCGIPPLSSTEFAPGRTVKMSIGSDGGTSSSGGGTRDRAGAGGSGKIVLDATGTEGGNMNFATADVPSGKTIGVHTLTVVGAGTDGADLEFSILSDRDISITPGGGGGGGGGGDDGEEVELVKDTRYNKDSNAHQMEKKLIKVKVASVVKDDYAWAMIENGKAVEIPT